MKALPRLIPGMALSKNKDGENVWISGPYHDNQPAFVAPAQGPAVPASPQPFGAIRFTNVEKVCDLMGQQGMGQQPGAMPPAQQGQGSSGAMLQSDFALSDLTVEQQIYREDSALIVAGLILVPLLFCLGIFLHNVNSPKMNLKVKRS